jgi:hypothetical protein
MKLCQVTAILTGKKTAVQQAITEINKRLQKTSLFVGLSKRYTPRDEEGESFPDENQKIQFKVDGALTEIREAMTSLIDLTATQDVANCTATSDVIVDVATVLVGVPVTHLLWLQKTLNDLHTLAESVPVLDPQETWTYDSNAGCYVSDPITTTKTRKVPKVVVKYEATKEHPAQTELMAEDIIIGTWRQLKFAAAMPADTKKALLARIVKLQDAVKLAREEANSSEVSMVRYGKNIFDFVLGTE